MRYLTVILTLGLSLLSVSVFAEPAAQVIDAGLVEQVVALWSELNVLAKVFVVLYALSPVASVIVSITPTPKDDRWYATAYKFIELAALNFLRAKQKG